AEFLTGPKGIGAGIGGVRKTAEFLTGPKGIGAGIGGVRKTAEFLTGPGLLEPAPLLPTK
ncbi:MAG TPA: hypothetical protein V6D17_13115, partial [Candidatus Obscuribacterales bacterium]